MDLREIARLMYDLTLFIGMATVYMIEALVLTLIPRRYRAKSIRGEIALVTGAASGIGRLIAIKLAELGAHVVVWDINEDGLATVAEEIKRNGGICHTYRCDIADKEEVYRVAKAVQIEVGNVSLLVNNAGYAYGRTLMELPDIEIERTFRVNVLSHYWIIKSFLEDMIKANHGHIVTVSSIAGLIGNYKMTDYAATKFATVGYHESLLTELKMHGHDKIHMTLVCPYAINTGMFPGIQSRLLPILEPEYVAEEVVSGILTNEALIVLPNTFKYLLPFKCWLPPKIWWWMSYHVFQAPQCMVTYRGRELNIINNGENSTRHYIKDTYVR